LSKRIIWTVLQYQETSGATGDNSGDGAVDMPKAAGEYLTEMMKLTRFLGGWPYERVGEGNRTI